MKNLKALIGNRTRDMSACSIVPKLPALPCTPIMYFVCVCVCVCVYAFAEFSPASLMQDTQRSKMYFLVLAVLNGAHRVV